LPELDALFHRRFVEIQDEVSPLPGLYEFLDFCRASGRRLFLLSAMKQEHFDVQSAKLGLRHYFEHPYAGVVDKRAKIGEILDKHGLARSETAFVGDMIHDVETARHGGVMSIAVLTGYDSMEKLTPSKPDVVVSSLDALRRLLQDPRDLLRGGPDCIRIHGLEVPTCIGVGKEERSQPQKLVLDVQLETDFHGTADDIGRATDYAVVAEWLTAECTRREVRLLETLIEDLAEGLLAVFPRVSAVWLEIRKFVLPNTESVSVRIRRTRSAPL
jgi:phosphoglycolate phosphatase